MATAARAARIVRTNVRVQAQIVGCASPLAGIATWLALPGSPVPAAGLLLLTVTLVAAVAGCLVAGRSRAVSLRDAAVQVRHSATRVVAQAAGAAAPLVLLGLLVSALGSSHPIVGGLVATVTVVIAIPTGMIIAFGIVVASLGSRDWWPREPLAIVTRAPHAVLIAIVATIIPACFVAAPILLVASIVAIVLGPAGALVLGAAGTSLAPLVAAVSLALWRELGGEVPAPPAPEHARRVRLTAPSKPATRVWLPSQSWRIQLDPAQPWGTWIEVDPSAREPQHVGVRIDVHGDATPRLLTCNAAGEWLEWPVPPAPDAFVVVSLEPGSAYLHVQSTAATAMHASVTTFTIGEDVAHGAGVTAA